MITYSIGFSILEQALQTSLIAMSGSHDLGTYSLPYSQASECGISGVPLNIVSHYFKLLELIKTHGFKLEANYP